MPHCSRELFKTSFKTAQTGAGMWSRDRFSSEACQDIRCWSPTSRGWARRLSWAATHFAWADFRTELVSEVFVTADWDAVIIELVFMTYKAFSVGYMLRVVCR